MIPPDINLVIYACNEDFPFHVHASRSPSGTILSAYLFSIRRPDRYLWITLDNSV